MKRRAFLRHLMAAPVAATSFVYGNPFGSGLRFAHAGNGKTLVVIFQRGGCDGLNTVIPHGEGEYYNLRSNLAIAPPGSGVGSALDLDGFFGLHPALAPLHSIYQQGDLAAFPAVHYANATRSHFDGQDLIETGIPKRRSTGWLNRYLANMPTADRSALRAVSYGSQLSRALTGYIPVPAKSHDGFSDSQITEIFSRVKNLYGQSIDQAQVVRHQLHRQGRLMIDSFDRLNAVDFDGYQTSNGAKYPDSPFGKQLRQVAQLIKQGVGLEVATVDSSGWDTHSNQGGAEGLQAARHADLGAGIAALYKDLGGVYMNDVLILTMTEFGRTVKENASGGTDHGNASAWFAIGGNVTGGIHGDWPGLGPQQLYQSRYLAQAIDYSDILGEVITRHLGGGGSLAKILPGHSYQPVGFL